ARTHRRAHVPGPGGTPGGRPGARHRLLLGTCAPDHGGGPGQPAGRADAQAYVDQDPQSAELAGLAGAGGPRLLRVRARGGPPAPALPHPARRRRVAVLQTDRGGGILHAVPRAARETRSRGPEGAGGTLPQRPGYGLLARRFPGRDPGERAGEVAMTIMLSALRAARFVVSLPDLARWMPTTIVADASDGPVRGRHRWAEAVEAAKRFIDEN